MEIFRAKAALSDRYIMKGERPPIEVVRQVFAAAALVLKTYAGRSSQSGEGFPVVLADRIANQIQYIVAGKLPGPIADLTGRGRPGIGPHEERDFAIAVVYIKA